MKDEQKKNKWVSIKGNCILCGEVIIIGMMDLTKLVKCLCDKKYLTEVEEIRLDKMDEEERAGLIEHIDELLKNHTSEHLYLKWRELYKELTIGG